MFWLTYFVRQWGEDEERRDTLFDRHCPAGLKEPGERKVSRLVALCARSLDTFKSGLSFPLQRHTPWISLLKSVSDSHLTLLILSR